MSSSFTLSRRAFAGAAAATAAMPAVNSVAAQDASPVADLSGDVTMWMYPAFSGGDQAKNEAIWQGYVDKFKAVYPNVNVKFEVLPWKDRNEKLIAALAAGTGPDVAYLIDDFIAQHAEAGNLLPLDDDFSEEDKADIQERYHTALSYKDHMYAFPMLGSALAVVVNKKLFDEVGATVPTTWEELLAEAPKFKEAGAYITSYIAAPEMTLNMTFYPLLWQAGGDVLNEDGTEPTFQDEPGVKALEFIKTLYENEYIDQEEALTLPQTSIWLQGKVGMLMNGQKFDIDQAADPLGMENMEVYPPLKNVKQVHYGTSAGLSVFSQSKNPEAAKAWAKFVTSTEALTDILPQGGFLGPRESLKDLYKDDPVNSKYAEYASMMRGGVQHVQARPIIATVTPYVQAAMIGDQPIDEALNAAAEEVTALLAE